MLGNVPKRKQINHIYVCNKFIHLFPEFTFRLVFPNMVYLVVIPVYGTWGDNDWIICSGGAPPSGHKRKQIGLTLTLFI